MDVLFISTTTTWKDLYFLLFLKKKYIHIKIYNMKKNDTTIYVRVSFLFYVIEVKITCIVSNAYLYFTYNLVSIPRNSNL